ncbi:hypothetical protein SD427_05480 [Chryseobacterium sp. JJR-5R]|uniref:hypothetical protein n=1 Tax=Chryseobacterium sp. JJR-5R TaxID=3093923 RepID=UPI002A7644C7|nr:hypothetical protein [Chryseobacterium sp. JJR-5R]WPO83782.1 hypothetical protein SD427_05480 [Chryseobacterium sp. JJR-5R]
MSNIISYHFPLDSLENRQIINIYQNVTVSSGLSGSKIDFDTRRGSFLSLANHDFINFTFDAFAVESDKSYIINLFFNYETLSGDAADNTLLNIDNTYSLSIRNNVLMINADPTETLIPNTWYNITITMSRDAIKTILFNKEIGNAAVSPESVREIKLQGGETVNIKLSDLNIQEEVNAYALDSIRNYQNVHNLSVFSTIHFRLYNKQEYKDRLFLENDEQNLFLDIDFGNYAVEFDPGKDIHIILKAKKGFFKKKESSSDTGSVRTDGDDFCIQLKGDPAKISNHQLSVPVPFAELVNLRNQDQVLIQLELINCTLKTADHKNITVLGDHAVTIDRTISIQDSRGAEACPFDVFVFGNDTLYNGGDGRLQTIILRVMNNRSESIAFRPNSSFEITSRQIGILKEDVLQAANIKVKASEGRELMLSKDGNGNLKVSLMEDAVMAENHWIDIEISGVQANAASGKFPSGSYPFYLEYRNIPGYRNGKTKFYIKTGKIFYYYN